MSNTSATGGYLQLTADNYDLSHIIHDFIAGLTALDNTLIRPAYQNNPPTAPSFGANWVAYNIKDVVNDGFSEQRLTGATFQLIRQSHLNVSVSFYGNDAYTNILQFKNALEITQNYETIRAYGFGFGGSKNIIRVPELHNERWLERYDMIFTLNQNAVFTTAIMSLSASSSLISVKTLLEWN